MRDDRFGHRVGLGNHRLFCFDRAPRSVALRRLAVELADDWLCRRTAPPGDGEHTGEDHQRQPKDAERHPVQKGFNPEKQANSCKHEANADFRPAVDIPVLDRFLFPFFKFGF